MAVEALVVNYGKLYVLLDGQVIYMLTSRIINPQT